MIEHGNEVWHAMKIMNTLMKSVKYKLYTPTNEERFRFFIVDLLCGVIGAIGSANNSR